MAADLDISLIAEGVETKEEEQVLLDLDIFLQQGFLHAAPLDIETLTSTYFTNTLAGEQ
jgi:EAL domain-containing protein (putative c-di-GMP-specific phosphodiesterase class I)